MLDVDFNITDNCRRHRTYFYEITELRTDEDGKKCEPQLVVRRGQQFDITLNFDRPFDGTKDDLRLIFDVGKEFLVSPVVKHSGIWFKDFIFYS